MVDSLLGWTLEMVQQICLTYSSLNMKISVEVKIKKRGKGYCTGPILVTSIQLHRNFNNFKVYNKIYYKLYYKLYSLLYKENNLYCTWKIQDRFTLVISMSQVIEFLSVSPSNAVWQAPKRSRLVLVKAHTAMCLVPTVKWMQAGL